MTPAVDISQLEQRVEQLVAAAARQAPGAIAVVCGGERLNYRQLLTGSSTMAARLRAAGVGRGSLVGVHLERSTAMLVTLLAILSVGAAYVPLDPEFPAERLAHMVADSRLAVIVSQSSLAGHAPAGSYQRLDIDVESGSRGGAVDYADAGGDAGDLIYVLYTSGSTGLPKGVALEHRNVVNFLLSMQQQPGLSATDRLLAVTTLSFDIAGLELFLPLISGACVVIAERDDATDGQRLGELIAEHGITVMQATPTTWRLLLDSGWTAPAGFKALCGGEALPMDLSARLAGSVDELWNMYGPTETAIWSTCFRLPPSGAPILIGKPIANTSVHILDRSLRPVPVGVPGEIFIGGAGVARGYLERPELTAERFVADPFAKPAGGRMYRTGDLGRYLPDGNIEFRQRVDNQVKIRGFRVELGEVEAALQAQPGVKQAVCNVVEIRPGDQRLVGYIIAEAQQLDAASLREGLRARLPQYMIPQHVVPVDGFPLLPNGKVNRRQLPHPRDVGALDEIYRGAGDQHGNCGCRCLRQRARGRQGECRRKLLRSRWPLHPGDPRRRRAAPPLPVVTADSNAVRGAVGSRTCTGDRAAASRRQRQCRCRSPEILAMHRAVGNRRHRGVRGAAR